MHTDDYFFTSKIKEIGWSGGESCLLKGFVIPAVFEGMNVFLRSCLNQGSRVLS